MPGKRAFTLVELLVVVTIIVTLLALLAPALDRAVDSAGRMVCQTRMRALNTAVHMYAMNHRRWLPEWLALKDRTVVQDITISATTGVDMFWWHRLHDGSYIRDPALMTWRFEIGPNSTRSPFSCPEPANHNEGGNNPNLLPQWIAYNIALGFDNANPGNLSPGSWWEAYRHVRLSKVEYQHETFMFGDCFRASAYSATVRGDYILAFGDIPNEAGLANMTKHHGTANYLFVDGHAENLTQAQAQERANRGKTGADHKTEYFFLPFASTNRFR
jgi:prepilin-type N-terminal cleavage/methylation domain-containing protein/prepilin-type processing-associated H-X9-DG protein